MSKYVSNFNNIFKKFSNKIYQFGKVRNFLDTETRVSVYKQTVLPLTEYVSFVLNLNNKYEVEKLQKLQNRALHMCYHVQDPKNVSARDLHERAKMVTLEKRRSLQLYNIMFDLRQRGLFEKHHNRQTRNANKGPYPQANSQGICSRIGDRIGRLYPRIGRLYHRFCNTRPIVPFKHV